MDEKHRKTISQLFTDRAHSIENLANTESSLYLLLEWPSLYQQKLVERVLNKHYTLPNEKEV